MPYIKVRIKDCSWCKSCDEIMQYKHWKMLCKKENRFITIYRGECESKPPIPDWCPILLKDEDDMAPEVKCNRCGWKGDTEDLKVDYNHITICPICEKHEFIYMVKEKERVMNIMKECTCNNVINEGDTAWIVEDTKHQSWCPVAEKSQSDWIERL